MRSTHESYLHPLKLGNIILSNNVMLAPLAGYSHKALRIMARRLGAGYAVTEMVSVEGLLRGFKKTWSYVNLEEEITGVQIFGLSDPARYYQAAVLLRDRLGVKIIDINFGCPVRKVIRSGSGSFHLTHPQVMGDIVKAVKDAGVLCTAKIRTGFDQVNIQETIPVLNQAQADMVVLHGRTAAQGYSGHADWDLIRKARSLCETVFIANGDINTPEDALKILATTQADGIMIGRAGVGTPYIFDQIRQYLSTGSYPQHYSLDQIKSFMKELTELYLSIQGGKSIIPIRSALIQYVRAFDGAKEIRRDIALCPDKDGLYRILSDWKDEH